MSQDQDEQGAPCPRLPPHFGEIDSPSGALFQIRNLEDESLIMAETIRVRLRRQGITITPEMEAKIERGRVDYLERREAYHRDRGVPEKFVELFSAPDKRAAEKLGSTMIITGIELAELICNCDQIGYAHRRHHSDFVPEHLQIGPELIEELKTTGLGNRLSEKGIKMVGRLDAGFKERQIKSVHFFERGDTWHAFYFRFQDLGSQFQEGHHWKHGSHIHYTSHLWGFSDKEEAWRMLQQRRVKLADLHIRYDDSGESEDIKDSEANK